MQTNSHSWSLENVWRKRPTNFVVDPMIMCLRKVGYEISNFAAAARMDIGHFVSFSHCFHCSLHSNSLFLCIFCTCKPSTQFTKINANASLYVQASLLCSNTYTLEIYSSPAPLIPEFAGKHRGRKAPPLDLRLSHGKIGIILRCITPGL